MESYSTYITTQIFFRIACPRMYSQLRTSRCCLVALPPEVKLPWAAPSQTLSIVWVPGPGHSCLMGMPPVDDLRSGQLGWDSQNCTVVWDSSDSILPSFTAFTVFRPALSFEGLPFLFLLPVPFFFTGFSSIKSFARLLPFWHLLLRGPKHNYVLSFAQHYVCESDPRFYT